MRKIITDAGRSESGFADERKDCTVRALSLAGKMEYKQAHDIMTEAGRRYRRGESLIDGLLIAQQKKLLKYEYVDLPQVERLFNAAPGFRGINGKTTLMKQFVGPNIKQFVEQHQQGRYIVRIKRHVFAVINGKMYDLYKQHGGALVKSAFKINLEAK